MVNTLNLWCSLHTVTIKVKWQTEYISWIMHLVRCTLVELLCGLKQFGTSLFHPWTSFSQLLHWYHNNHQHDCPCAIEATLKNIHMIALVLLKQPWKTSTWLPSCYWSNPEKHPHDCPRAIEATLKNIHMIALVLLKQPWKTSTWLPSCYWSNPEKHPHDCPRAIEATLKNIHMIGLVLLKQPWKTSTWLPSCYWSNPEKHPHDCPRAIEATLKNIHMIALVLLKQPWKTWIDRWHVRTNNLYHN